MKNNQEEIGLVLFELRSSNGMLSQFEAARLISRSPRRFRAMFRQVVGETYRVVRVRIKMQIARRHLIDTDDSILEVATHLGYARRDKFEAAFKREFGLTPAQLRVSDASTRNGRSGD